MKKHTLLTAVFAALFVALQLFTAPTVSAACGDPAGPGVDWSGCDKSGVSVAWLDMSGAILVGTNLTDANLDGANLTGADLTNAVVTNAQTFQTDFTDATLFGATGTPYSFAWANYNNTICPSGANSDTTPHNMCYAFPTAVSLRSVAAQPEQGGFMPIAVVASLLLLSMSVWVIRHNRKRQCS